jgi:hypothetical protein
MSVSLIIKRISALRLGGDFRPIDMLLLLLFAILGLLGFSRFPSYQDLEAILDDFSRWWILIVLAFNILLISKIFRKCFLEEWLALLSAAIIVLAFGLTTILLSLAVNGLDWPSAEKLVLISSGGLATFLLAAQTWLDLKPDLTSIKTKLREFDKSVDHILHRTEGQLSESQAATDASEALREEIRRTINSDDISASVEAELKLLDERIKEAASVLRNPRHAMLDDLQEWKVRWKEKTYLS